MALTTEATRTERSGLGATITDLLGADLPVRIDCYDGSSVGPPDASTQLVVRSPDAFRYMVTAPGELGFARAYVAGELEVDGDIFEALSLRDRLPNVRLRPSQWLALARLLGARGLRRPPVPRGRSAPARTPAHARSATRPRSRTTTTCRTSSTAWCSGLR